MLTASIKKFLNNNFTRVRGASNRQNGRINDGKKLIKTVKGEKSERRKNIRKEVGKKRKKRKKET
jgi:hypothetical protein